MQPLPSGIIRDVQKAVHDYSVAVISGHSWVVAQEPTIYTWVDCTFLEIKEEWMGGRGDWWERL